MDKEGLVHIHSGILLSYKKNTFESVLMRWMKLEPAIQSEISQKKKSIQYINTYIWNLEHSNNDPICKTEKEIQM